MVFYALKRICLAVLIVIVAVSLLYSMIHAVPGDPTAVILGPRASAELREALAVKMGLDLPLWQQILGFFGRLLQGDLGTDVFSNRPVADIIFEQLPHTLLLIGVGITWAALLGIPLGAFSAIRRNSFLDKLTAVLSVATIAVPSFVIALYALLIFAVQLQWLPAIGAGEPGDLGDQATHLILPAFAIGLAWVGYIARIVRASMLEVLGENHIRTARAYGLRQRTIVFRYALRIALAPTVTLLGVGIGGLLSSAVFAEIVFARPGIGKLIFDAVTTRNYPVVMGSVLVTTAFFVLSTTVADLVNAFLDPRSRQSL